MMDTLMWFVTACSYISYIPQIFKLVRTKRSEGISTASWVLWVSSSLFSSIWAIWYGEVPLIVADLSELLLCLVVLVLSIRYGTTEREYELCGVTVGFNGDWVLLNCIIDNVETTDYEVMRICKECTVPAVLQNVVTTENLNVSVDTREFAFRKLNNHINEGGSHYGNK